MCPDPGRCQCRCLARVLRLRETIFVMPVLWGKVRSPSASRSGSTWQANGTGFSTVVPAAGARAGRGAAQRYRAGCLLRIWDVANTDVACLG